MEPDAEWVERHRELSEASRADYRLRTLSPDKRAILGTAEYRRQCRSARRRLKLADESCLKLRRPRMPDLTSVTTDG